MDRILFLGLFLFILLIGSVDATFGVSAPCDDDGCYWGENKLVMRPGESKRIYFNLKGDGENDISVDVELIEGVEIAKIVNGQERYKISKEGDSARVGVDVVIPEGSLDGEKYSVRILAKEVLAEGGNVQFKAGIGGSLSIIVEDVLLAENEGIGGEKFNVLIIVASIVMIFSLIVVFVLIGIVQRGKKKMDIVINVGKTGNL